MSAGIVPYLVQLDDVRSFPGSHDTQRLERLQALFKREIADNAALQRQAIADGAPSIGEALRQICDGSSLDHRFGAQYVYALELLCAHAGQKLRNLAVYPVDDEWLMRVVDPVFDAWRLGDFVKFKRMIYGRWPIKLPHAEFPRGGALEAADVERALGIMRGGALPKFDREIIGVIGEVRGWLEAASARKAGIVCFYY